MRICFITIKNEEGEKHERIKKYKKTYLSLSDDIDTMLDVYVCSVCRRRGNCYRG